MKDLANTSEIIKARILGFIEQLRFEGNQVVLEEDGNTRYNLDQVSVRPKPCCIDEQTVYLITTPCGIRWITTLLWADISSSDYYKKKDF